MADDDMGMNADVEKFGALAWCPKCDYWTVHPFRMAKHRAPIPDGDDPVSRHQRYFIGILEMLEAMGIDAPALYDPDGTEVMRQCVCCGHEWGQR